MKRSTTMHIPFHVVSILALTTIFDVTNGQGESCSVCGENLEVMNPEGIFEFPGQPAVPCGTLDAAGKGGMIPISQCDTLPPLISSTCDCKSPELSVILQITARTNDSPFDPCRNILPFTSRCELEELRLLKMQFLGGNCTESLNQQETPSRFICEDYGSLLSTQNEIYLEVKDTAGDIQYFADTVQKYQVIDIGDSFIMNPNINLTIYEASNSSVAENILQTMKLSSDCDDGTKLYLGDVYGSLQLVGFGNQEETIQCNAPNETSMPTLSPSAKPSLSHDDCSGRTIINGKKACGKETRRSKKGDKMDSGNAFINSKKAYGKKTKKSKKGDDGHTSKDIESKKIPKQKEKKEKIGKKSDSFSSKDTKSKEIPKKKGKESGSKKGGSIPSKDTKGEKILKKEGKKISSKKDDEKKKKVEIK